MLVTADAITARSGAGIQYIAIDAARRQLADVTPAGLRRFPPGAGLGQCCGGVVNLLIEPVACDGGWLDTLAALAGSDAPFVIVTRVQQSGGAGKLLVTADAEFGTLGDPRLDRQTVAQAREFLDGSRRAQVVTLQTDDRSTAVQRARDLRLLSAGHTR
jgi:xanthine/CO dehydrogenase XdhC/CoxF family maturation factor